jgi:hypothetical protein
VRELSSASTYRQQFQGGEAPLHVSFSFFEGQCLSYQWQGSLSQKRSCTQGIEPWTWQLQEVTSVCKEVFSPCRKLLYQEQRGMDMAAAGSYECLQRSVIPMHVKTSPGVLLCMKFSVCETRNNLGLRTEQEGLHTCPSS